MRVRRKMQHDENGGAKIAWETTDHLGQGLHSPRRSSHDYNIAMHDELETSFPPSVFVKPAWREAPEYHRKGAE